MSKINLAILLLFITIVVNTGCKKFLDAKPDKQLVLPETLKDLQALLDNSSAIHGFHPIAGEVSADNYYITDAGWAGLSRETDRRMYLWEKDLLFENGITGNEWSSVYGRVYRANSVLDNIDHITITANNKDEWSDVKGQALFIRANSFLHAAYIWAPAYDETTAASDLGIALRLKADFTEVSLRSSLKETYSKIIEDLKLAIQLLPVKTMHVSRPSKSAAYALLAQAYLSMRKYDQVALYADSSLQLYKELLDYRTINPSANYPFLQFNKEYVSYGYNAVYYEAIQNDVARIDSNLYKSYEDNDIRKTAFFKNNSDGTFSFKGSYMGRATLFLGLTTAEIYLMRAEAFARLGKVTEAMQDLNTLLVNRWKTGTFIPLTASNKDEALNIILEERRKELIMRSLRWMDIKRLNKEGANIILTRKLNGKTYVLPPNDPRYALPIPEDVIEMSGMPQNSR